MHSFTGNLPELLTAMAKDGRILICIAELQNDRYIQFRVSTARTIVEVVSNQFLHDTNSLSAEDEQHLRTLGFQGPSSSKYPNWRYEVPNPIDIVQIVNIVNSSITSALHAMPGDPVRIKTFAVPSRGREDELDAS